MKNENLKGTTIAAIFGIEAKLLIRALPVVLLGLFLSFSNVSANETVPDDIIGIWLIEEDGEPVEKIEIFKCGDLYCGKIVWIKQPDSTGNPVVDEKNSRKELKNRPLLGLEVIKDYRFDGKDTWKDGKFYAHRKGKTVSPKLTLIDDQHLKIQVKILFVKKSFVWQRVLDAVAD